MNELQDQSNTDFSGDDDLGYDVFEPEPREIRMGRERIFEEIKSRLPFCGRSMTTGELEYGTVIQVDGMVGVHVLDSVYHVVGSFLARNPTGGTDAMICITLQPAYSKRGVEYDYLVKPLCLQEGVHRVKGIQDPMRRFQAVNCTGEELLCIYHPVEIVLGVNNGVTIADSDIPGLRILARQIDDEEGMMYLCRGDYPR